MNKTLKTIAWICLALGLLGMVASASALIVGRTLLANRQAVQSGDNPAAGSKCIAEDANKDGKPDGDCLKSRAPGQPGQPGAWQLGIGGRPIRRSMLLRLHNNFEGRRFGGFGLLPLFFVASGPILAVVGAVILLVNREPKAVVVKEEKEIKKK